MPPDRESPPKSPRKVPKYEWVSGKKSRSAAEPRVSFKATTASRSSSFSKYRRLALCRGPTFRRVPRSEDEFQVLTEKRLILNKRVGNAEWSEVSNSDAREGPMTSSTCDGARPHLRSWPSWASSGMTVGLTPLRSAIFANVSRLPAMRGDKTIDLNLTLTSPGVYSRIARS